MTYREPFLEVLKVVDLEILEDIELHGNAYRGARLVVVQTKKE